MQVRTPTDVAALVRGRRRELGWTQDVLAERSGASPRWIVALEAGKASARTGMVLSVLSALGLVLDAEVAPDESGAQLDAYLEEFSNGD